jgi:hypothetical protein
MHELMLCVGLPAKAGTHIFSVGDNTNRELKYILYVILLLTRHYFIINILEFLVKVGESYLLKEN